MGKRNADNELLCETPNKTSKLDENSVNEKPQFFLTKEIVEDVILIDLNLQQWRVGMPIGKGSFGEIFLASDDISKPVRSENAKYVVKIEPHANGPLFVEIHCLLNSGKPTDDQPLPPGMPEYIASGSHYFKNARYRFLILRRYICDLHSIIKHNYKMDLKNVLIIAGQILDVLQHLHDKGYAHSDIKAENLMIGKSISQSNRIYFTQNHDNSSDTSSNESFYQETKYFSTIRNKNETRKIRRPEIEFSGSNPLRSCRMKSSNNTISFYKDMITSHYLRPSKNINYRVDDSDDESIVCEYPSWNVSKKQQSLPTGYEYRIYLIDFGLASKFVDSCGVHRPFCMDQRRAHDGTLEFTSRDAHMGAHSRRSDLECLGYNLMYWTQGFLPWKDEKLQNQPEEVHHMKEYFMTNVKEMLKFIYGNSVPKFLGEYMNYVGKLMYHEKPDYAYCRKIFENEFIRLGYKVSDMVLNFNDLKKKPHKMKDETENSIIKFKNDKSIMKLGMIIPFKENSGIQLSPKNLRSKKENQKRRKKKLSWSEILSTDPDRIARERAEKEFARDELMETPISHKYKGKPTYAILELENKMNFREKLDLDEIHNWNDTPIKGYTKPMMDVLRKRQIYLMSQFEKKKTSVSNETLLSEGINDEKEKIVRSKEGLRTYLKPTRKSLLYRNNIAIKKKRKQSKYNEVTHLSSTDETSCSSIESRQTKSSSLTSTSEGEFSTDIANFSPIKTRRTRKLSKLNGGNRRKLSKRSKLDNKSGIRSTTRG